MKKRLPRVLQSRRFAGKSNEDLFFFAGGLFTLNEIEKARMRLIEQKGLMKALEV